MPEADVTYADVKFTRINRGTFSPSDHSTYSEVKISPTREPPAGSHQNESNWRSKVTAERAALLVLGGVLVAAVIALGVFAREMNNFSQSVQSLKEDNKALMTNYLAVTVKPTCPPAPECKSKRCLGRKGKWELHGRKCYYFNTYGLTWQESRCFCKDFGGDLVKISSREEQEFLLGRVRDLITEDKFWIGLMDSETNGSWLWVDGSPLNKSLSFWAEGRPKNENEKNQKANCVRMEKTRVDLNSWFDKSCYNNGRSICEKSAETDPCV